MSTSEARSDADDRDIGVGVDNLSVFYRQKKKETRALDQVSINVKRGDLLVLLGPSGCGKSTLLNAIAGLLTPTEGRITVAGRDVFRSGKQGIELAPNMRNLGMIFQSYSLWPHMTVSENVAYPLKRRHFARQEIEKRVASALELVQCDSLASQYPGQLSGGQQQRIALARAIVAEPAVLLFDEPLSNLDANLRRQLRDEIAALHGRLHFSGIYVTHDQSEALSLGTHVAVMKTARIEQLGTPQEIHDSPRSPYVASFLGANLFKGTVDTRGAIDSGFGRFETERPLNAGSVDVAVYPQRMRLARNRNGQASISLVKYMGTSIEYTVQAGDARINILAASGDEEFAIGDHVDLAADPKNVFAFPK